MTPPLPKVFFSYSHDSDAHKAWVLQLAHRLASHNVHIILDQWDLTLGSDLPRFMASGLTSADRVLSICSPTYARKANGGSSGVGYEAMILTAQLMQNIDADRIIPVVRSSLVGTQPVPTFLSSKLYIDFSDDSTYETNIAELIHDLHRIPLRPRPPTGPYPFAAPQALKQPLGAFGAGRYTSPALQGTIDFDYSNNDGIYTLGAGPMSFDTKWSTAGNGSIHAYIDCANIRSVALAKNINSIEEIDDPTAFDTSSRTRTPRVGEILIWQNVEGYFLATKIEHADARSHGANADDLTFSYVIAASTQKSFR